MNINFQAALAFVWAAGRDNPHDGPHTSANDPGGLTFGGVVEDTWENAVASGIVKGTLENATPGELEKVLKIKFWGDACDGLPGGLDFLLFNGRMMSGYFPKLFQQCCGITGQNVDGWIGPATIATATALHAATLIGAVTGVHMAYLRRLAGWAIDGNGWTRRLDAARIEAISLVAAPTVGP